MNPFAKLPWLPYVTGFAVLGTLLVVFRGALGLSLLLVVLILLVLLLVAGIVFLILQLRKAQQAEEIEKTISNQADLDIERSTPGQLAEMQRLKEDLLAAIETLKGSSKKTGEDALATLPWYMVLGPAGAGKSELIKRSGLEFPLKDEKSDPRAVRGVGGTRGFSWWLSHEAVLLDMAGKTLATAAFDDSGDWLAFLGTLKKQRPEKPINGALVVVAVDQLADLPEARIDAMARAARERLAELIQHLGVVFPVYLVFTRCDQVAGFTEFFEDLSAEERRQPWGATLSLERARANPAEQLFDEEYGVLMASLSERRLSRMASCPEAMTRARAFAFPLQFERVRGSLRRFVRSLFEDPAGADAPLFRGFYLAASTQSGEPADRVMAPAVRTLGLTVRSPEGFTSSRGGAWFARDLFTEVVFPDAGLAVTSKGAQGRLKRGERMLIGAFGIAFVLFTVLFSSFSCVNGALVGRARKASLEVSNKVRDDAPIVENLRSLEKLRASTNVLDSLQHRLPLYRKMGGYSADVLREPALDLWTRKSTDAVFAPAVKQMELDLRQLTDNGQGSFLDYYYLFRAYRLLSDPTQIKPDDGEVLAREVSRALQSRLAMGQASPQDRRDYPELVRRQMMFLARHPEGLTRIARDHYGAADPTLTARAAERVRASWDAQQFYADMITWAGPQTSALDLGLLVKKLVYLHSTAKVPGPFTKEGWISVVKPRIEQYRALVQRDWLLQDIFQGQAPDLASDLQKLYARDYSTQWARFVSSLTLTPPRDLQGLSELIKVLMKGESELFQTLRAVRDQTQLPGVSGTPVEGVNGDWAILRDFFETRGSGSRSVGDKVQALTNMLKGSGGKVDANQSMSANYMTLLAGAQAAIEKVAQPGAPVSGVRKLLTVTADESNGLVALVSYVDGFKEIYGGAAGLAPTLRLLKLPVGVSEDVIVTQAMGGSSSDEWKAGFLDPFNRELAGKYPFAASREEASIDDVTRCFGPQGYFWAYYQSHLAPFLNEDGSPKGSGKMPVSPEMQAFVKRAYAIRQAFFGSGAPAFTFTVRTSAQDIDQGGLLVRRVIFDCGGESAIYSMGPPLEQGLRWPGTDATAGASLRVVASAPDDGKKKRKKNEPEPMVDVPAKRGDGLWGLFRLLDSATSVADQGSGVRATWVLEARETRIRVTLELEGTSVNQPLKRGFMRLSPPSGP